MEEYESNSNSHGWLYVIIVLLVFVIAALVVFIKFDVSFTKLNHH